MAEKWGILFGGGVAAFFLGFGRKGGNRCVAGETGRDVSKQEAGGGRRVYLLSLLTTVNNRLSRSGELYLSLSEIDGRRVWPLLKETNWKRNIFRRGDIK